MSEVRKSVISVTEMAKMVGLSRQRFNQLVKDGVFPSADHDSQSGRPFYNAEKQQQCLMVRQTNMGINGSPVLFYSRRKDTGCKKKPSSPTSTSVDNSLVQQLGELGVSASMKEVDAAKESLFPLGLKTVPHESVLKSLFLHFRRKNKGDSAG